jgi:pantoate--beta-alanine ligase
MNICTDPQKMQKIALEKKREGCTIGFVPTMGFLHKGHASLMKHARSQCDFLVVSIFINPLQFAPNEDLDVYPQDPNGDEEICTRMGVDVLFRPKELYLPNHSTFVDVNGLSDRLCGASRRTHFRGVCTVVARLFGLVQPDIAVFGEKDYQQLAVIRQLVQDLAMPINIIGAPLIRDADGMALSSRNRYLSEEERKRARSISQALFSIQKSVQLRKLARDVLKVDELDYLEFIDPINLTPVKKIYAPIRLLIAAWIGRTRLIDNILLEP